MCVQISPLRMAEVGERIRSVCCQDLQSRFPCLMHAQRVSIPVLEWFHRSGHFQDRIANRGQSVTSISVREEFCFDDTGPISNRDEFHHLARDLLVQSVFNYQSAAGDRLAHMLTQLGYGAVCFPSYIGIQFQWVARNWKI